MSNTTQWKGITRQMISVLLIFVYCIVSCIAVMGSPPFIDEGMDLLRTPYCSAGYDDGHIVFPPSCAGKCFLAGGSIPPSGENDVVSYPADSLEWRPDRWTISAWIKVDPTASNQYFPIYTSYLHRQSSGNTLGLFGILPNGALHFIISERCSGGEFTTPIPHIQPGVWNHVALTVELEFTIQLDINPQILTPIRFYVNSAMVHEIPRFNVYQRTECSLLFQGPTVFIGYHNYQGPIRTAVGAFDEIQVTRRALHPHEIQAQFLGDIRGQKPLFYLPFAEQRGISTYDKSGSVASIMFKLVNSFNPFPPPPPLPSNSSNSIPLHSPDGVTVLSSDGTYWELTAASAFCQPRFVINNYGSIVFSAYRSNNINQPSNSSASIVYPFFSFIILLLLLSLQLLI